MKENGKRNPERTRKPGRLPYRPNDRRERLSHRFEKIAYQGERGAFSEEAARKLLPPDITLLPCARFEDVFRSVKQGRATGAVIPIENTLAGSVHENYDHLQSFELPIVGETSVRIVHNLIAATDVKFAAIRRVYSHPVALNQCLNFFSENPQIERVPFYDTAGSVKMITEKNLADAAAIASAVAAEIYGARLLRKSIEDDRQNFTRFFLLRSPRFLKESRTRAGTSDQTQWKTSLVFTTRNIPGALFRALAAFALRDLNLTKIESRPLRGKPWEYLFYLDFLGRADSPTARNALSHLRELADFLRILGCYPQGA